MRLLAVAVALNHVHVVHRAPAPAVSRPSAVLYRRDAAAGAARSETAAGGAWFPCTVFVASAASTLAKVAPSVRARSPGRVLPVGRASGRVPPVRATVVPVLTARHGGREAVAGRVGTAEGAVLATAPRFAWPAASVAALRQDGVVLVPAGLSPSSAARLQAHCEARLAESRAAVAAGEQFGAHFGAVLARTARHDLKLALEPPVAEALAELLGTLGPYIRGALGSEEPVLAELGAIRSTDGAPNQPLHSDTSPGDPRRLLTTFVALQDVDEAMGPTTFLPGTHRDEQAHRALTSAEAKTELLRTAPVRLGVMPAGSCALYDSRLLHAGGANESPRTRWLLYLSFGASRQTARALRGDSYPELQRAAHTLSQLEAGPDGDMRANLSEQEAREYEAMWASLLQPREVVM